MIGRTVEVRTSFHSEGTKPGGVSREKAVLAAQSVMDEAQHAIRNQLENSAELVVSRLNSWEENSARTEAQALLSDAGILRDAGGLIGNMLLTETAGRLFDALDLVANDGKHLRPGERAVFSGAIAIAARSASMTSDQPKFLSELTKVVDKIASRSE